jgi:purine-binding chemotaxis protein CheW
MSEARKRARQKAAEIETVAAVPSRDDDGTPETPPPPPPPPAATEAPAPVPEEPMVFPADARSHGGFSSGGRFELPSSGLAADILAQEPGSTYALDTPPEAPPAPAEEVPSRGHSISFFSAPAREERTAVEETEHLATFFLDREEYGVDVRLVQEIRRVTEITQVPRAPDFIKGVINLRGRIIPVIDLKKKLGLGEVIETKLSRIVVITLKGRLLGLLVDGASQVLKVPVSLVEPAPPEVLQKGGDYLRGVAKLEKRLIILVDLETVLALELREGASAPA